MNPPLDRAFLHIGSPKTGTTTIQRFLLANRLEFLDQQVLVPVSVGPSNNYRLSTYASGVDPRSAARSAKGARTSPADIEQSLRAEIERHAPRTLVLSNEHLFSRIQEPAHVERLRRLLMSLANSVTVIVYLRDPLSFVVSRYSTHVKNGGTETFDRYLDGMLEAPNGMVRYGLVLDRWASVFGGSNIVVRPFERERLVEQSILRDFSSITGIRWSDDIHLPVDANAALPRPALEFLRALNERDAVEQQKSVNLAQSQIVRACREVVGDLAPRLEPTDAQRDAFDSALRDDQKHLTDEYLNGVPLTAAARRTPVEPVNPPSDYWIGLELARAQIMRRRGAEHDLLVGLSHAMGGRSEEADRFIKRAGGVLGVGPDRANPSGQELDERIGLLGRRLLEEGSQDAALVDAIAAWFLQNDEGAQALDLLKRANSSLARPMVLWARLAEALDATGQTESARRLLLDGIGSGLFSQRLGAVLRQLGKTVDAEGPDGQDRTE